MIRGMFGPGTLVSSLRDGLDEQSARQRAASDRVANLLTPSQEGFAGALDQQSGVEPSEPDLQRHMVEIADSSLRYDASTRLLQRVYQQFRTAIHERS